MSIQNFGICRLSVVPLRADTSERSEQVSQLLFGDHYEVIDSSGDKNWLRIRVHADQYEGWMNARQHHEISGEYFEYINRAEFKITTDVTATMLYNKTPLVILMGSIIPISGSELFRMEEQFAFNGESKNIGQKRDVEFLRTIAMRYLSAPYQWGGKSPFGIDCSGFTQMVFKISGYNLSRDAWQQAKQGKPIESLAEAKQGDLIFFKRHDGKISHVGILIGPEKIIHASGRVRIDHISDVGITHSETKQLTHHLASIRRVLPEQAS